MVLTIAQITDLHVTTEKDPLNQQRNEERLRQVMKAIHELRPRPAAIVASGDLVDRGEREEYLELERLMAESEIPVFYGMGNHDSREAFLSVFDGPGAQTDANGFIQYAVDFGPMRMIMVDTLDGPNHGDFCEDRAAWLAATLEAEPDKPTAIILHHPPIPSGIRWMDPDPDSPWIGRLASVLRGRTQVQALLCGHIHRAFNGSFAGHVLTASPATSIQLTLDLTEVDMHVPDGREILVEEPPAFALLMCQSGSLTTHICQAGDYTPAVTYNFPFRTLA